jgi:hypothetical protein
MSSLFFIIKKVFEKSVTRFPDPYLFRLYGYRYFPGQTHLLSIGACLFGHVAVFKNSDDCNHKLIMILSEICLNQVNKLHVFSRFGLIKAKTILPAPGIPRYGYLFLLYHPGSQIAVLLFQCHFLWLHISMHPKRCLL